MSFRRFLVACVPAVAFLAVVAMASNSGERVELPVDARYPQPDGPLANWPGGPMHELVESVHFNHPERVLEVVQALTEVDLGVAGMSRALDAATWRDELVDSAGYFPGVFDDGVNDWWNLGILDRKVSVGFVAMEANRHPADDPPRRETWDVVQGSVTWSGEGRFETQSYYGRVGEVSMPAPPAWTRHGMATSGGSSSTMKYDVTRMTADMVLQITVTTMERNGWVERRGYLRAGTVTYWLRDLGGRK